MRYVEPFFGLFLLQKASEMRTEAVRPYDMCGQLFALTPAVEPITERITLLVGTETYQHLTLTRRGVERRSYVLSDWSGERVVVVEEGGARVQQGIDPERLGEFLGWALNGVPIPRNGTIFGEIRGVSVKRAASLLVFHSERPPHEPEMEVLIDADLPPDSRPASYRWLRLPPTFWEAWRRGTIVDLAEHFKQRPETVFRMTIRRHNVRVFAVAHDITVGSVTLPKGRFVAAAALWAGRPISPLPALLDYERKDDQFNAYARANLAKPDDGRIQRGIRPFACFYSQLKTLTAIKPAMTAQARRPSRSPRTCQRPALSLAT